MDAAPSSAEVYFALADDSDTSQVSAGENKGRTLHHVAVLRSLQKIGAVKRGGKNFQQVAKITFEIGVSRS